MRGQQAADTRRMNGSSANRVFISYRRDDAAGYAGRLEEALEKRVGHAGVFRDVRDIPPGEDFVAAIRARLSGAQTVLVLIGPLWAGGGAPGLRRIDDAADFVRLEVALALDSGARVVPVLLPGAEMPAEADLPEPLKPLARRHALSLSDAHWDADIARLADAAGLHRQRRVWPWALGGAAVAASAVAALCWIRPGVPADPSARLVGSWQAEVTYGWGDEARRALRVPAPRRSTDRHRHLPGLPARHREADVRRHEPALRDADPAVDGQRDARAHAPLQRRTARPAARRAAGIAHADQRRVPEHAAAGIRGAAAGACGARVDGDALRSDWRGGTWPPRNAKRTGRRLVIPHPAPGRT